MGAESESHLDAFTHLAPPVRQALSARGFSTPTQPQQRAIPPLTDGVDALVIAPTGTGKTESAMLPVFSAIVSREPTPGFAALLVTPLRSLNRDLLDRLDWWGDQLDIAVDVRHGDTTQYQRRQQATDPPDLLITTPETVQAMLTGSKLREALADIEHVVVDEIHELAGSKRGAQLTVALERLRELAGPYQRIGLSATVGDPDAVGQFLTGNRPCDVIEARGVGTFDIQVVQPDVTAADERLANELMADVELASHLRVIDERISDNESTLVFVNTRQTAEGIGSRLKAMGTSVGIHHGSLSKEARIDVEDRFKAGDLDALLCTSSMELGIDVGRIDHVVQYQSPRQVRRLVQRIGRAGHRHDEVSRGTIVTSHPDDTLESLVIARRAANGSVESAEIHHGSLDTLANQIVGMVMGYGELGAMRAYTVATRAYPFADISERNFKDVLEQLASTGVVYVDQEADRISKRNGSWQYFYSNLSMIPDEAKYTVADLASGRTIGTLDERFVVDFAEPGELFVERGEMWRIAEVDEAEQVVEVSPVEDPTAEVPSWTGAEIPVPFDVAQEVGETRATVGTSIENGHDASAIEAVESTFETDHSTAAAALRHLVDQEAAVPTADRIVVEYFGRTVVINACFGHKVNETLGRLVSALLGQQTGSSIGFDVDPYRVELEVPSGVSGPDVMEILTDTDPAHVEPILELSLRHTQSLQFTLAQVATKFGVIQEWRTSSPTPRQSSGRLVDVLDETPVYTEAAREVLHEDLATDRTAAVLRRIQAGSVTVTGVGDRTAIGIGGRSSGLEILSPEKADASIIATVRERIQNDRMLLCCLHCKEWTRRTTVKRIRSQPRCPQCDSTQIAALNPWADDVVDAVRNPETAEVSDREVERAYRAANLVQSHGKKAVIALAGRGVGPENAARIINRWRDSEDEFYRDILEREQQYAKTKAFWD